MRYEAETGNFFWTAPRPKIQVGQLVGYKSKKGYIHTEINGKHYACHRLAWFYATGKWPECQIDHINRDRSDNRIENLRLASNGENRANSKTTNKLGFKGVTFKKWLKEKPYEAKITFQKKVIYLGCYATPEEAHISYKNAAIKFHKEFARP